MDRDFDNEYAITPQSDPNKGLPLWATLLVLAVLACLVSGITVWAVMYSLNMQGVRSLAVKVETVEIGLVQRELFNYLSSNVIALNIVEETYRTASQWQPLVYLSQSFFVSRAWQISMQFFGSDVFIGFPNDTFYGYIYLPPMRLPVFVQGNGSNFNAFQTNHYGAPSGSSFVSGPFRATTRPWYRDVMRFQQTIMTGPYVYAAEPPVVGMTVAVPLFADLMPPKFNFAYPLVYNTSQTPPAVREVIAVIGVDIPLFSVAEILNEILNAAESTETLHGKDRTLGYMFDGQGYFIGSTNVSIPVGVNGSLVRMTEVTDPLINASQSYILSYGGASIEPGDYASYARVQTFYNEIVSLPSQKSVLSCFRMNVDNNTGIEFFVVTIAPYSFYYGDSEQANQIALIVIFVACLPVIAVLAGVCGHCFIARPVRRMSCNMDNMANDLVFTRQSVPNNKYIRELVTMEAAFEKLRRGLVSFSKFAPMPIVRQSLKLHQEAELGVNDVVASCFFSDIASFTSITETTPANVLIETLKEYFNGMSAIIEEKYGVVGNFIGDAIFALFNGLHPVSRHAFLACETAMLQQELLEQLRVNWAERGMPQFHVRIGINSGLVLAGNVGSAKQFQFTFMGDTVNVAARLEKLCKVYGVRIVLSNETYSQLGVREAFVGRVLDLVMVAGRRKQVLILTLLSRRGQASESDLKIEQLSWQFYEHYIRKEFDNALACLQEMQTLVGLTDLGCTLLIARINEFKRQVAAKTLPGDWNGAVMVKNK